MPLENVDIQRISTSITPDHSLDILSPLEVQELLATSDQEVYAIFRRCALAILNSGAMQDDAKQILDQHADFQINVIQQSRGIKLELINAPQEAFVDGNIIRGIRAHLFSALRDIVYLKAVLSHQKLGDINSQTGTTDMVFRILRNAGVLQTGEMQNLVVCWGGHSISREEYDYSKAVGYELGLRGANIVTGCGPGAMKGPMKGGTIAHAKQHIRSGRYIGLTEPGIVASEPPNPIVNELVILPDIEKRLEAFVRLGHGIIIFPGGVGTTEETLYLLGILLHPKNANIPFPIVLTGPASSAAYFEQVTTFLSDTLGDECLKRFEVIVGDPAEAARKMMGHMPAVRAHRRLLKDAYYFNWQLEISREFQMPFDPTHTNMRQLDLHLNQPKHHLAAALRCAFSGIVAGNVKDCGIKAIEQHGPFELSGDTKLMQSMDNLLRSFVKQKRMKLGEAEYRPCYKLVTE
ncbi:MAG: nucleotide 5'-monophosphate nucleosidase PpnN [Pseudomonadota bacterium]